jgi:hypothetical protein
VLSLGDGLDTDQAWKEGCGGSFCSLVTYFSLKYHLRSQYNDCSGRQDCGVDETMSKEAVEMRQESHEEYLMKVSFHS